MTAQKPEPHNPRADHSGPRVPLSIYMIVFNNGSTVEKALRSVAGWADEVVVVDSQSSDGSPEVITKYTDRFFQFGSNVLRDKYQYAQDQCRNPWVLFIDADEWLTDGIKKEIEQVIGSKAPCDGYIVDRRNYYLGKEIKYGGWYPDREIRLYRKEKGAWKGDLHAKVHVEGRIGHLGSHYMHAPYGNTSDQIKTIDRYSETYANDLWNAGKKFHITNLIFRPLYRFFRDYILKRGFLDGVPGLIVAISTVYYVFMKQAKLWELERQRRK
jgi:glycosyltransferase involved in cell wall biosynthesis